MVGERAKSIGEEAEDKVWTFLDSLGYSLDTNIEGYDIDCIAESPREKPKVGLAKPRYSPSGLVAFEVRESTVSKQKVTDFRKKILKYNRENNRKLSGGIYLLDRRISPTMLSFMRRRRIWGWGIRRQRLYQEKINAFNYWFKMKKSFTSEVPIDKHTSCLRMSTPPPTRFRQLLHFSVFFDDIDHKLSPKTVKQVMNRIKRTSISPLIDLGIRPMKVYFEFFSIGGLSKRLVEETYKNVIEPWKDEEITVHIKADPFRDFRAFSVL
jgi:hypothetical protein